MKYIDDPDFEKAIVVIEQIYDEIWQQELSE
jgi:hypothetical protein